MADLAAEPIALLTSPDRQSQRRIRTPSAVAAGDEHYVAVPAEHRAAGVQAGTRRGGLRPEPQVGQRGPIAAVDHAGEVAPEDPANTIGRSGIRGPRAGRTGPSSVSSTLAIAGRAKAGPHGPRSGPVRRPLEHRPRVGEGHVLRPHGIQVVSFPLARLTMREPIRRPPTSTRRLSPLHATSVLLPGAS